MLAFPLWAQYAMIGVAVVLSLCVVLSQQMPAAVRRLRLAVALRILKGRSGWAATLGKRIAPEGAGTTWCGGCNGCASSSPKE